HLSRRSRGEGGNIEHHTWPRLRPLILPSSFLPLLPSFFGNSPHSRHCEADRFEFRDERLCLLGCEFDQRRPHRPPCRIVRVDRNGLFQRSDHQIFSAEHVPCDIQLCLLLIRIWIFPFRVKLVNGCRVDVGGR